MSDNKRFSQKNLKICILLLTSERDLSYKMSMQGGSWFLHSRERRRLNQTACNLSKAGVPFASAAGTSFWAFACGVIRLFWQIRAHIGSRAQAPTWVLPPSQNDRFPKTVKTSLKINPQIKRSQAHGSLQIILVCASLAWLAELEPAS